jgi:hypothetical protein
LAVESRLSGILTGLRWVGQDFSSIARLESPRSPRTLIA